MTSISNEEERKFNWFKIIEFAHVIFYFILNSNFKIKHILSPKTDEINTNIP